jgi:hypothetical protein
MMTMKKQVLIARIKMLVLGIAILFCLRAVAASAENSGPAAEAGPNPSEKEKKPAPAVSIRAVSLKILQQRLKSCPQKPCADAAVLQLGGLKAVTGYVVDEAGHDLILVGQVQEALPNLYFEDLIVALKNTWLKYAELKGNTYYYANPGCSIDPDEKNMQQLNLIGQEILRNTPFEQIDQGLQKWHQVCQSPQKVRVLGIPFDTRFAAVMVKADYDMKRLVDGSDTLDIAGFSGLTDRILAKAKSDILAGRSSSVAFSSLNRFWFYPGANRYLADQGGVLIEECPVVLLTEEEFLDKRGKLGGSGAPDPTAKEFVESFSALYEEVAKQRPIYTEL